MTITVVAEPTAEETTLFRAMAGTKQATGPTLSTALDTLSFEEGEPESGTLILVQRFHPDRFLVRFNRNALPN
jgi:hypothetical protein